MRHHAWSAPFCLALILASSVMLRAETASEKTVEQLVAAARKSVVVISFLGRDGRREGLGSGFVVDSDGLIATNLHVIGEARPITVQLADGRKFDVTGVHATERSQDLAVLRIDAKELPALPLADSDELQQGQRVVAIGNPLGLEQSVVEGIVSGKRTIDDREMIQLAIPIERGNSGGPLLDMRGRVHGILTLKSAVSENLGFAVAINALKPLLEKPNPIPIARWLTIGALPREWTTVGGARWRQRAGAILVEGRGTGFGGRSLCLSADEVPEPPFEVAVSVRFTPESGAAGLVFHADGEDRHYGFYPSNGELRLTRFDGPDVFSWHVLKQVRTPQYQPGEWNTLKVRCEKDRLLCYINDELVIESTDHARSTGRVGLAKFRETEAEFKNLRIGTSLPASRPSAEEIERIARLAEKIDPDQPPKMELIEDLARSDGQEAAILQERARLLEQQAERLRQLATAVHQRKVQTELVELLSRPDTEIDLPRAALLVSRLDNPELDIEPYLREVKSMAETVKATLEQDASDADKLAALNRYLYEECGYHGSRTDYYNRSNSYLNEVIDDREGLPITLSVLYIELARRLGVKIVGVGLPGHFLVRHLPSAGDGSLIDVFDRGKTFTRQEAMAQVVGTSGLEWKESFLDAQTKKQIIIRMLRNLMGLARDAADSERMLSYIDTVLRLDPELATERWYRAVLFYQADRREQALADVDWLLEHAPADVDLNRVEELRRVLLNNVPDLESQ